MRPARSISRKQYGFSLVELMVGMVIGLMGIIIIMQVTVAFQSQKSTATSGSKAQNTAAISLYSLQREIEQAGYAINSTSIMGCSLQLPSGATLGALAPLLINHPSVAPGAADTNTDTIIVAYGNPMLQTEGDAINQHGAPTQYTVAAPLTFSVGDYVIAQAANRPSPCSLVLDKVTAVSVPNSTVTVQSGTPVTFTNGTLYNLGPAPKIHAYAVRLGILNECDFVAKDCSTPANITDPATWVPIGENIVDLRALYGRDATAGAMKGIVTTYDQTQPAVAPLVAVPPANNYCGLARISALRIALVARSSQFEKGVVTNGAANAGIPFNAPAWSLGPFNTAAPITGPLGVLGPDTAKDEPWKHYRYKVFETAIPLRNISWMGKVSGC